MTAGQLGEKGREEEDGASHPKGGQGGRARRRRRGHGRGNRVKKDRLGMGAGDTSHVGCSPVRSCNHRGNLAEALGLDRPGQVPGALSSSTWTGLPGSPDIPVGIVHPLISQAHFPPKKSLAFPGIEMKKHHGPQKLALQAELTTGTWAKETAFCVAWEGRHTWHPWRSVYCFLP